MAVPLGYLRVVIRSSLTVVILPTHVPWRRRGTGLLSARQQHHQRTTDLRALPAWEAIPALSGCGVASQTSG